MQDWQYHRNGPHSPFSPRNDWQPQSRYSLPCRDSKSWLTLDDAAVVLDDAERRNGEKCDADPLTDLASEFTGSVTCLPTSSVTYRLISAFALWSPAFSSSLMPSPSMMRWSAPMPTAGGINRLEDCADLGLCAAAAAAAGRISCGRLRTVFADSIHAVIPADSAPATPQPLELRPSVAQRISLPPPG